MLMFLVGLGSARASVTSDAWARFYSAFADQIGGDASGISFVTTTTSFGSNYPSTGGYEEYTLCDNAPAWGGTYKSAQFSIYDSYTDMVDSLDFEANTVMMDRIAAQETVVNNAQASWANCIQGLTAQWINFHNSQSSLPPEDQWTYTMWYNQLGAPSCSAAQTLWNAQVVQLNNLVAAATQSGYEYVSDAINDLTQPSGYTSVFTGTSTLNVSLCTFSPDAQSTITGWQTGQGSGGSFTVNSKASTETDWTFSSESGGAMDDPIVLEVGGKYSQIGVDTSSMSFSMTVSWAGLQTFSMNRGVWWDGEVLQHKEGPFLPGSPIYNGQVQLWGQGGTLGLVPSQAIVAYQPTVSVTLDEQTYTQVKNSWSAETGVCIFIFCFESVNSGSNTKTSFDDQSFSFTMTDTSIIPKLVAVISTVNLPPAAPFTEPTLQLDIAGLQAHSIEGVSFKVMPHAINIQGHGAPFHGNITISSVQVAGTTCNVNGNYPNLNTAQVNCINSLGLSVYNTGASLLYYESLNTRDLAHLNMGPQGNPGAGAHLTCRPVTTASGRHTPVSKGIINWFKGGCCTGSNWPSDVNSDMQKIVQGVLSCLN